MKMFESDVDQDVDIQSLTHSVSLFLSEKRDYRLLRVFPAEFLCSEKARER